MDREILLGVRRHTSCEFLHIASNDYVILVHFEANSTSNNERKNVSLLSFLLFIACECKHEQNGGLRSEKIK